MKIFCCGFCCSKEAQKQISAEKQNEMNLSRPLQTSQMNKSSENGKKGDLSLTEKKKSVLEAVEETKNGSAKIEEEERVELDLRSEDN